MRLMIIVVAVMTSIFLAWNCHAHWMPNEYSIGISLRSIPMAAIVDWQATLDFDLFWIVSTIGLVLMWCFLADSIGRWGERPIENLAGWIIVASICYLPLGIIYLAGSLYEEWHTGIIAGVTISIMLGLFQNRLDGVNVLAHLIGRWWRVQVKATSWSNLKASWR